METKNRRILAARIGAIAGFIFILIAAFVIPGATSSFDNAVTRSIVEHRIGFMGTVAHILTTIGGTVIVLVLAILALGYLAYRRKILELEVLFGALAGDVIIVTALKKAVQRHRPPENLWIGHVEDQESFPSGHSANNTVLWLTVALIFSMIAKTEMEKRIAQVMNVLCWVMPLCIGLSRIYVAQHWATDVLAGWSLGLAWVSFVAWVYFGELDKRAAHKNSSTPRTVSSSSD